MRALMFFFPFVFVAPNRRFLMRSLQSLSIESTSSVEADSGIPLRVAGFPHAAALENKTLAAWRSRGTAELNRLIIRGQRTATKCDSTFVFVPTLIC